jgi:hypothetical protein
MRTILLLSVQLLDPSSGTYEGASGPVFPNATPCHTSAAGKLFDITMAPSDIETAICEMTSAVGQLHSIDRQCVQHYNYCGQRCLLFISSSCVVVLRFFQASVFPIEPPYFVGICIVIFAPISRRRAAS